MADIELVIKVPEDVFKRTVFYREFRDLNDCVTTIKALEKAVFLPKGHGRLIDADKVRTELDWLEKVTNEGSVVEQSAYRKLIQCINVVNDAPTIIEADKEGET